MEEKKLKDDWQQHIKDMKERRKRDAKRLKRILKPRIASAKRKEEVKDTVVED